MCVWCVWCSTCVYVILCVGRQWGGGQQAGAELVFVSDAEQRGGPLQHQVPQPVGHARLQVLLVDQPHDQHRLRQADHQERHTHHKIHT